MEVAKGVMNNEREIKGIIVFIYVRNSFGGISY